MKPESILGKHRRHIGLAVCAMVLTMSVCSSASAANHALLMWISSYAEPSVKLRGIEFDVERARQMASQLGVPVTNRMERYNEQLTFAGMQAALLELSMRVGPGDKVFIYFSGHGARSARAGGPGCQEGLVTHEGRLMLDILLRGKLQSMAERASQVTMFTDACHAGGVVTKGIPQDGADQVQVKAYPGELIIDVELPKSAFAEPVDPCTVQVNVPKSLDARSFRLQDADRRIFHLAAAAENEAAFATSQGSIATQAWAACMKDGLAATGEALARCSQDRIEASRPLRRQTVTTSLNAQLPLLGAR